MGKIKNSITGGFIIPFLQIGKKKYYKIVANNPNKTDSVLIGPDNGGLALDDGEIVEQNGKTIRVASKDLGTSNLIERLSNTVPIDKAFSLAFNRQEQYKKENGLNDDGSSNRDKAQNGNKYIIKQGDNIKSIAKEHKIKIKDIISNNPEIKNFDYLIIGDTLNIPIKNNIKRNDIKENNNIKINGIKENNTINTNNIKNINSQNNQNNNTKNNTKDNINLLSEFNEGKFAIKEYPVKNNNIKNDNINNTKNINSQNNQNNKKYIVDNIIKSINNNKFITDSNDLYNIIEQTKPIINNIKSNDFVNNVIQSINNNELNFNTIKQGIKRKIEKITEKSNIEQSMLIDPNIKINSNYSIYPTYHHADTLMKGWDKDIPSRFTMKEYIPINEFKYEGINRGEDRNIYSSNAPITLLNPLIDYDKSKINENYTYIGYDKNGNLKVGTGKDFNDGDKLSRTFRNNIIDIKTDENGKVIGKVTKNNKSFLYPITTYYKDDGTIGTDEFDTTGHGRNRSLNIMWKPGGENIFSGAQGGRVIIQCGNEIALVSGSIQDIKNEFESMKKRNNVNSGYFYTLDNGTFQAGLKVDKEYISKEDFKHYYSRNVSGRNLIYIIGNNSNNNKFPSDTILTPNIRTINSDSFKKGHSLTNELKGVVFHHTGYIDDKKLEKVTKQFMNNKDERSAHVIIGEDGKRRIFAYPENVTFHAGESAWYDEKKIRDNVNDFMLGIEFQGDTNKKPLTNEQIESVVEYLTPIIKKYNIPLEQLVTHQDVSNMYDTYIKKINQRNRKIDINKEEYYKIINALIGTVYYKNYTKMKFGGKIKAQDGTKKTFYLNNDNFLYNTDKILKEQFNTTNKSNNKFEPLTYHLNQNLEGYKSAYSKPIVHIDTNKPLDSGLKGWIPYVGDALSIAEAGRNVTNKNYLTAGITGASLLLPNILEKPAKAVLKKVSPYIETIINKTKNKTNSNYFINIKDLINEDNSLFPNLYDELYPRLKDRNIYIRNDVKNPSNYIRKIQMAQRYHDDVTIPLAKRKNIFNEKLYNGILEKPIFIYPFEHEAKKDGYLVTGRYGEISKEIHLHPENDNKTKTAIHEIRHSFDSNPDPNIGTTKLEYYEIAPNKYESIDNIYEPRVISLTGVDNDNLYDVYKSNKGVGDDQAERIATNSEIRFIPYYTYLKQHNGKFNLDDFLKEFKEGLYNLDKDNILNYIKSNAYGDDYADNIAKLDPYQFNNWKNKFIYAQTKIPVLGAIGAGLGAGNYIYNRANTYNKDNKKQYNYFANGGKFNSKDKFDLKMIKNNNIYSLSDSSLYGGRIKFRYGGRKKGVLGNEDEDNPYLGSFDNSYNNYIVSTLNDTLNKSKQIPIYNHFLSSSPILVQSDKVRDEMKLLPLSKNAINLIPKTKVISNKKPITYNKNSNHKRVSTPLEKMANDNPLASGIGEGVNILGSIINNVIQRNAYNNMSFTSEPIKLDAQKLLTNYDISPLKEANTNAFKYTVDSLTNNTSSSLARNSIAQNAKNQYLANNANYETTKVNKEVELINADRKNRQSIDAANVTNYNNWLAINTNEKNQQLLGKANSLAGMINNIGNSANNFTQNYLKNNQFLASVNALGSANPEAFNALMNYYNTINRKNGDKVILRKRK